MDVIDFFLHNAFVRHNTIQLEAIKMKRVSILNDVIGPIMRGPSSSHTAGPWRIGRIIRDMLGENPAEVIFYFHPISSMAICYHDQGSDLAFVAGILNRDLTDPDFPRMLEIAQSENIKVSFKLKAFPEADHPNSTLIEATGEKGKKLTVHARSIGGGSVEIASINGIPVKITGDRYELILILDPSIRKVDEEALSATLRLWDKEAKKIVAASNIALYGSSPLDPPAGISDNPGVISSCLAKPILFPLKGKEAFKDTLELLNMAERENMTLGKAAIFYEETLLDIPASQLNEEMDNKLKVMLESVHIGLTSRDLPMKLLTPTAWKVYESEKNGALFVGGIHSRAAARALAVMHVNSSGGVVCACPTGGSAGVIPAILSTLMEDFGLDRKKILEALWAAGAVGLALARRSTFAAEVAGCQVEIGAAGAMGAAAVIEAAGGTAKQACDAAAIVFQNIMGSVCDLVQGVVEIPCHTRNAALASQAFLCADLILGGYENLIPLDETIDAVNSVGEMLPVELRCTSRGGLACCPSAQRLPRRDRNYNIQGAEI